MEEQILLWIHQHSHRVLDIAFRFSHELATQGFCAALVSLMVIIQLFRRNGRDVRLWLGLGLSTLLIVLACKPMFGRVRPALWEGPIHESSYSMPSGHALAAATFYGLLAWEIARRFPRFGRWPYLLAALLAFYIGLGRLYLGVHWPTDVLAGWTIGAAQTFAAVRLSRPQTTPRS